jgi:hypothetical protein
MHLWDRILPQAVMTLNMLRNSRINPKLSAATHIFVQYDFNRAPPAPPGTIIIYMKHQAEGELGHPMGTPWARWLVHWTSIRTLQMLYGLHHKNKNKQNSGNSRVFSTKNHFTISIISRLGDSGRSRSHARLITPTTSGPILSGRRRTSNRLEVIRRHFRVRKTTK